MADVITKYKLKKRNSIRSYYVLFSGLFIKVETPKSFKSNLYLRNTKQNIILTINSILFAQPFKNLKVELDSQEFEKNFNVYCTDKIIALQLLTADIMQLLINFKYEMNMNYEITIKNSNIYIRFFIYINKFVIRFNKKYRI